MDQPAKSLAWQAESLRFTIFEPVSSQGAQGLWERVVGRPPEVSTAKRFIQQYEGPFGSGKLSLIAQPPGRTDWIYSAIELDDPATVEGPAVLGAFSIAQKEFFDPLKKWLGQIFAPVMRVAFGAVLSQPVPDRRRGYELLVPFLPSLRIDVENSSDLLYQINRPRMLHDLDDVTVNRLSKWNVLVIQLAAFMIHPNPGTFESAPRVQLAHAARLELDINTAPREGGLPSGKLIELLDKLAGLASEISSEGDCA